MTRSRPAPGSYRIEQRRDDEGQRACARGDFCSSRTRDADGAWHPALTYQPFCPADTGVIRAQAAQLPALLTLAADPRTRVLSRPGRPGRRTAPGPRVNMSVQADALLREAAAVLGGWAARVRAVPGIDLAEPDTAYGTLERTKADCATLAAHVVPLLALPDGWMYRRYDVPPGSGGTVSRATAACRLCGRVITRSPVSGWWWAPADGMRVLAAEFCDHQPSGHVTDDAAAVRAALDFGGEIVTEADGWVKVEQARDGTDAGTDILDLHYRARVLTGCIPAQRETITGVPCRREACDRMGLERADPPSDPSLPSRHSRCPACRDEMTPGEFAAWSAWYAAYARGAVTTCRRCVNGDHAVCEWGGCQCAGVPHPRRRSRAAA